jgi:hypothetical protein
MALRTEPNSAVMPVQHQHAEKPRSRRIVAIIACALLVTTVLSYAGTLEGGFILVDDDEYVQNNPHVLAGLSWQSVGWAFSHQQSAMYHPITTISHMADVQFFGVNPARHHLVNILLHAVNAALLFVALLRLTGQMWPSAFVAAVFALHPQHVESVAWISERKDVLSGFFFMLCLLSYEWYARRPSARRYLLVALSLIFGLLSKPMLVTVPFILLLLDFWPLKRRGLRWLILEKLPLLGIAAMVAVIALITQQRKGAVVFTMRVGERVSNAILSYMRYVGTMFWPSQLSFFYPHPFPRQWPLELVLGAGIAMLLFSAVVLVQAKRLPTLFVGWAWFVIMLLPVIGLVQVGTQAMADRYSYLPSIGLTIAVTWLAMALVPFARYKLFGALCISGLLLLCLLRTVAQAQNWRDQELLYESSLESVHESSSLRNVLGWVLFQKGRPDEAIDNYERVLSYEPENQTAHAKLGVVLLHEGRLEEAHEHLTMAARLNPQDGLTLIFLAGLYQAEGDLPSAISAARRAVELDPTDRDAQDVLEKLLRIQQQRPERGAGD